MADDFSIDMTGMSATMELLDTFVGRQVVLADAAVQGAALVGLRVAQSLCPVGTPESTGKPGYVGGTLKKSLHIQRGVMSASIVTSVSYGPYVEFGTYKMAAQPFMGPGFDAGQIAMWEMLKNNM